MNAASTSREQPSIVLDDDSLNESTSSAVTSAEDSYGVTNSDDSQPVITFMAVSRGPRTIDLEDDEQLEFSTPPTSCQSTASRQDNSEDPLAVIGRCWQECVRQAELQKAHIDLLKQTKLKEKIEFDQKNTELKEELKIYKQKCAVLEDELRIVREHQYASGSSSEEQHQSQRNDLLISKGIIVKSLEIFTCCICNELLIKPGVTNCNHTFCLECLDKWRVAKKDCPVCRAIITNVHVVNEIDEYITSILGYLSDEVFAERLQMIDDRNCAHSTVPLAPVKKRRVMFRQDLARNEEDDDSGRLSFFSSFVDHVSNSTSSPLSTDL